MEKIFEGVFRKGRFIATANLVPGSKVYGEDLFREGNREYRYWQPKRSKLGAAILKGLRHFPFSSGSRVLYLGAASGTTVSHISDVVGPSGLVYCVEFSPQVGRDLILLCEKRGNLLPIIEDARRPEAYAGTIDGKVDVVYEDVADSEQARILRENCDLFLKPGGIAMIAVKARCIDSTAPPKKIYARVAMQLSGPLEILQQLDLAPFEMDHAFLVLRKK